MKSKAGIIRKLLFILKIILRCKSEHDKKKLCDKLCSFPFFCEWRRRTFINLAAHVFYTYRKSRASVLARFNFREVLSNQFEYRLFFILPMFLGNHRFLRCKVWSSIIKTAYGFPCQSKVLLTEFMAEILFSNINISMRIINSFQMVALVFTPRIMGRPVRIFITIEVVIRAIEDTSAVEYRPVDTRLSKFGRSMGFIARVCHVFNDVAVNTSVFPIDETSSSWITSQPVVDVAFYQDLLTKLMPPRKVHGVVIRFAERWGCRYTAFNLVGHA